MDLVPRRETPARVESSGPGGLRQRSGAAGFSDVDNRAATPLTASLPMRESMFKYRPALANLGLFYSAAIWGSTFYLVKDALSGIDPVMLVAYRFLIAGVLVLGYLLVTGRKVWVGLGKGAILAVLLWFLYIPQTIGLQYTTASNSGFITGLFVIFVPIFMRTVFRRKPSWLEWLASAVALAGLWVLTGGLTDMNTGDGLTLLAAVTYALHLLFADRYLRTGLSPLVLSCQQFLIVGLLSLLTGLVFDLDFVIHTEAAAVTMVFLALFPTLAAFVIQMWAQKTTSPVKVSLIFAFEPVFAALFAWTLGGETPVLHRALGGLLVFAALVISGLPVPGQRRNT
jgi:drug/metabolite transporter (DMT)-like permease